MTRSLESDELMLYLGQVVTTSLNLNGSRLECRRISVIGSGVAEICDGPRIIRRWTSPCEELDFNVYKK